MNTKQNHSVKCILQLLTSTFLGSFLGWGTTLVHVITKKNEIRRTEATLKTHVTINMREVRTTLML